jgi:hypothetical protein
MPGVGGWWENGELWKWISGRILQLGLLESWKSTAVNGVLGNLSTAMRTDLVKKNIDQTSLNHFADKNQIIDRVNMMERSVHGGMFHQLRGESSKSPRSRIHQRRLGNVVLGIVVFKFLD